MRKIVALLILLLTVILIMPVDALQNDGEKIPVLINFKEKADADLVREYGGDITYNYTLIPVIAAKLTQDAIDALSQNPNIDFIEPDGQAQIPKDYDDFSLDEVLADEIPWGISRINATAAQALGFKGSGVKVAVIDSGIDYTHPDLKANYLGGYDFYNGDSDPMDDHSHGTHVSGTVAAPINGIGVVGVAPEAKIYGLKVFGSTLPRNNTSYSNIMAGIEWAVNNDADIITMSLSGPSYSSSLKTMCDYAYNKGVVLVGSAGNTAGYVRYPAAYDSVIAVSAINSSNKIASWSCYGPEVDFTAPGVNVKSTMPGSSYGYKDGTSMSAPHVTGAIALLLSTNVSGTPYDLNKNGKWDPAEVYSRLKSTAIDLGTSGKDNYYGYGLIDAYAAVKVFAPAPVASTAVYNAVYDNRIRQTSPTTVYSTSTYLDIGKSTSACRDLILFDLSSYKTTDTISKATLSLYWYFPAGTTRTSDTVVEVYRPVEWDTKYVTWNYRTSGVLWGTDGGNWYDKSGKAQGSAPYATLTFPASTVPGNKYYDFDVTDLVKEYVSGKYKNTGFFLKARTESGNYIAFYSSAWSNAAQRPKLTITSSSGSTSKDAVPVANAGADKTATTDSVVTFSGSASTDDNGIASYSWDFDVSNGITSEATGVTATHVYPSAGTYTVTLTVTDTAGQKSTDTLKVVVSSSVDTVPVANAGADKTATTDSFVTFSGSASTDDKGIASYSWDFDVSNGIIAEASGVTATHTYTSAGTYTVTLTVTDTAGQKSSDTLQVVVTSKPAGSATSISTSYSAVYDNRMAASSPTTVYSSLTYLDVGKSSTSSRDVMLFDLSSYKTTDTISKATLSLYWYYPVSKTRTFDTIVDVYRPVEWDPKYVSWNNRASGTLWSAAGGNWYDKAGTPQGSTPYASVTFSGSKVPDNKYYDFNVTQLVQEYVSGKYKNTGFFLKARTESGNYIAFYSSDYSKTAMRPKLTITSISGSTSIDNPPVANAGADKTGTTGSAITFDGSASTDDKGIASYSWDFDVSNGITSEASGVTATHIYTSPGTYTVTLTVTDTAGQKSTDTLKVIVSSAVDTVPVADAGADHDVSVGSAVIFDGSASSDDKGIASYSWDFDVSNGITSEASGVTATHTYAFPGTYTVTLTVTDTAGQKDTDTVKVIVSGSADSVTYSPIYDNRLRESSPNTVLSTSTYLDIGRSTSLCRDVMLFDLSGYNATDTISKATLSLYWYYPASTTRASDTVVEVYRPVAWDPNYVSWNYRISGNLWNIAGGEWYDVTGEPQGSTPYAFVIFPASTVPDNRYYDFDVTQLVQEYTNGTYENTGFLLKAKAESGNYIAFYSLEYSNTSMRPKLTITTTSGSNSTDASPVADAGADKNATVGSVVSFNGSGSTDDVGITSYSWDFNAADGITSEAGNVTATHVYTSAGNYTVTLTVMDNKGQTSTDTLTVFVSVPVSPDTAPTAAAGPDQNATVGSVVSFNGSGSTDDVGITSYSWDFNAADGITSEATNVTATHVYTSAGNYTVTLTVTDNKGQTSTDTLTVFVSEPLSSDTAPVAAAGPDQNATVGSVVSFNGSGSTDDVGIISYSWDFNASDGITSEATNVTATHVYASAGNYTVTLTVTDNKGQTSNDSLTVFVSEPISPDVVPVAAAGPDQNVTVGSVVIFNGSGSTDDVGITSYSWDFNASDGITSEATNMTVTHVYASAGNYTVTLTVTDKKGQTSTDTLTVFVRAPVPPDTAPVAAAGPDQNATVGSVVIFNGSGSTDDMGITSYSWDFNAADGITSEADNVTATHVYTSAGNYTVTLTVTDNKGQTSNDTLTVFVSVPVSPDDVPVDVDSNKNDTFGSVTYLPVYDNGMRASSPNSVISTAIYLDAGKNTSICRDVMLFDLSGYNATDTISKATLSLYWYYPASTPRASDTVVEVYRPVAWDPNYVSWNYRTSGTLWNTAGGNWYDITAEPQGSAPYASVLFPASVIPDNKYYDFDVTQLVREYINGTYENTGFFIKAKAESGNYIAFYSSDYSNADMRPKLTISS